jgi:hypothetical protein
MMERILCQRLLLVTALLSSLHTSYAMADEVATTNSSQEKQSEEASKEEIKLQRPQGKPLKYELPAIDPNKVDPPAAEVRRESLPVPDRWRIMEGLGIKQNKWDPYNQNVLKGDKPFEPFAKWGEHWFLNIGAISDTLIEARQLPTAVGAQSSGGAGALDIFGQGRQSTINQNVIFSAAIIEGDTTFKPPDYEFRLVLALNANRTRVEEVRAINIDPRRGKTRNDSHIAIQELFFDKHLRNVSDNYDFDSLRIGIQPFISDFRGFVFQDNALGVRLFGTRDNNRWQYNAAWFRRIEKDTNSGLNDIGQALRRDDTLMFNVFRQDFPVPGHTLQLSLMHNVNREGDQTYYNNNGFLERPAVMGDTRGHDYRVTYLGASGDGHFGRWNLSTSFYAALGSDDYHPLAQQATRIKAGFAAAELSRDFSWVRIRATAIAASGDKDPFDDKETGFDAILENPQIAGADTSFWIRQAVPLIGGGNVALSGRNALLPSLRSSKDQGQSNFVNPGLTLLGVGADFDIAPQLRVIGNISKLDFIDTATLEVLRNQGGISADVGIDVSASLQYRPRMTQNIVLNASFAALLPGKGFKQLYDDSKTQYSALLNLLMTF